MNEIDEDKQAHIVLSIRGRDKGNLFFVVDAEDDYFYLADGYIRKLEKPKKKKMKHVKLTGLDGGQVARKLLHGERVTNRELRRTLAALTRKGEESTDVLKKEGG